MKEQFCKVKPLAGAKILPSPESHDGAKPQFAPSRLGKAPFVGFGDSPTASKYNGGTLDKKKFKFLIGIDYLTMNLKGKLPIELDEYDLTIGEYHFINCEKATRHFQTMFNLYHSDILIGVLVAYPREGNSLDPNTIQLKIENQNLYSDLNLVGILIDFMDQFEIGFSNVTRVDIYLDSYGFKNGITLNDLDYLLDSGQVITDTRVTDKNKYSQKVNNRFITTGFTWGSRKTGRYLRIYNKTLELAGGSKTWIQKYHEANGLTNSDVYRFEYELKNDFLKHLKNFEWMDLFTPEGCFELLDSARKGHFSFRIEDGQARNDRKEQFELIDWDELREYPEFIFDYSYERKRPQGHSLRSIRVLIGSLLKEYVINEQPEETLLEIKKLINQYNLTDWFHDKHEHYLNRFLILRYYNYEFDKQRFRKGIYD